MHCITCETEIKYCQGCGDLINSLKEYDNHNFVYTETVYKNTISDLESFSFSAKTKIPTFEQVLKSILKFTTAQMKVVKKMKNPVLQLKPKCKKDAYITALNKNKSMPDQIDAYVTPLIDSMWNDRDAEDGFSSTEDDIIGWQVGFIEGAEAPDVLPGDDINKLIGERCAW